MYIAPLCTRTSPLLVSLHFKIKLLHMNHVSSLHITSLINTQSPIEFPCFISNDMHTNLLTPTKWMKLAGLSQFLLTERSHLPTPGEQDSGTSQSLVTMCTTHNTHTREALGTLPIHACPSACFNLRITGRILIHSYVHVTSLSFYV